jgi:hypothetical protein
MILLRRLLAFITDSTIFIFLLLLGSVYFERFIEFTFHMSIYQVFIRQYGFSFMIFFTIFYWIFIEVIFKCSIGKWIFRLRFINYSSSSMTTAIFYRNLLRFCVFISVIGIPLYFIYYIFRQICWYDKIVGIDIAVKDTGLTDIQKNWRKYFR